MKELTKQEWLDRCANAFDMGLITRARMSILDRWTDAAIRAGAVACGVRQQSEYLVDFMEMEHTRLSKKMSGGMPMTLASDEDGYSLVRLAAVLGHRCQTCATSSEAWHTRSALCPHNLTP